jgi:hypothetical protein
VEDEFPKETGLGRKRSWFRKEVSRGRAREVARLMARRRTRRETMDRRKGLLAREASFPTNWIASTADWITYGSGLQCAFGVQ